MNNQKRLRAAWDQVVLEVAQKRGDTYTRIVELLAAHGSELTETPTPIPALV